MRLKLIACEMLSREMCAAIARSPQHVDFELVPKTLPDAGRGMLPLLQELVDGVDPARYDAILLGYALCGNCVDGLVSRSATLVIPRVHDSIALRMGCREYSECRAGVYFRSTGWLDRGDSLPAPASRYGEELSAYRDGYRQLTYIRTGLEPDGRPERQARFGLFEQLLHGEWDERDFLVVPPGWRVKACYNEGILDKEPVR